MNDVFIYKVPLPAKIKGATILKDDDYIVFINELLSEISQEKALNHELRHIKHNHLYDLRSVKVCEVEACGGVL
jgi:hypothetical protein